MVIRSISKCSIIDKALISFKDSSVNISHLEIINGLSKEKFPHDCVDQSGPYLEEFWDLNFASPSRIDTKHEVRQSEGINVFQKDDHIFVGGTTAKNQGFQEVGAEGNHSLMIGKDNSTTDE